MSYGSNFAHLFHRAATFVDKILKGANPGDLSIEQPTKFELVINPKTAKALGLIIPKELLLRADEVIQQPNIASWLRLNVRFVQGATAGSVDGSRGRWQHHAQ